MNFTFLIGLLKGSNTYDTVVKILGIVAGFLAARDANNTGTDKTAPLEPYSSMARRQSWGRLTVMINKC